MNSKKKIYDINIKDLQLSLFSLMKDDAKLSSDGANLSQPLANKIEGQHRPTKCKFINSSFCKKNNYEN